MSELQWC